MDYIEIFRLNESEVLAHIMTNHNGFGEVEVSVRDNGSIIIRTPPLIKVNSGVILHDYFCMLRPEQIIFYPEVDGEKFKKFLKALIRRHKIQQITKN
jgi:hypothetical protein